MKNSVLKESKRAFDLAPVQKTDQSSGAREKTSLPSSFCDGLVLGSEGAQGNYSGYLNGLLRVARKALILWSSVVESC